MSQSIQAILFDKDGTLYSFDATWGGWCADVISDYSHGSVRRAQAIADALAFDLEKTCFHPHSPVIAGTADVAAELILPHMPGWSFQALLSDLNERAGRVTGIPPTPLRPLLEHLREQGLALGVATNDAQSSAIRQLERSGVLDLFSSVLGYDSGYGAKPWPGQLLAFAKSLSLPPAAIAMVGDATHDLNAAHAAGCLRVGVLTGPARKETLLPHCDLLLNSIADLPGALFS